MDELRLMFKHVVSPDNIACFLVEPVQGEGGYIPALQPLSRVCAP